MHGVAYGIERVVVRHVMCLHWRHVAELQNRMHATHCCSMCPEEHLIFFAGQWSILDCQVLRCQPIIRIKMFGIRIVPCTQASIWPIVILQQDATLHTEFCKHMQWLEDTAGLD